MSKQVAAVATTSNLMVWVLVAMLPGLILSTYFFSWGFVIQCILTVSVALISEAIMLYLRHQPLRSYLTDGSAVLTALLLAICIPPLSPWWISVVGITFAIILTKHVFGGLGHTLFNPAMMGFVVVLIAFPQALTGWSAPLTAVDLPHTLQLIFSPQSAFPPIDSLTHASPLDLVRTERTQGHSLLTLSLTFSPWGWLSLAWTLGGLILWLKKIIHWVIPLSVLGAVLSLSYGFYWLAPDQYASPGFHLFQGATLIGAFFIATDPVTAPSSMLARLCFGVGIGCLTVLIRNIGGYPEGLAFAVLLMNLCVPLMDRYIQPRVYGHTR